MPPICQAIAEGPKSHLVDKLAVHLAAGENPNEPPHKGSISTLEYCLNEGSLEAVRVLIADGADPALAGWDGMQTELVMGRVPDLDDPLNRDRFGRTPFLFACNVGNVAAAKA